MSYIIWPSMCPCLLVFGNNTRKDAIIYNLHKIYSNGILGDSSNDSVSGVAFNFAVAPWMVI